MFLWCFVYISCTTIINYGSCLICPCLLSHFSAKYYCYHKSINVRKAYRIANQVHVCRSPWEAVRCPHDWRLMRNSSEVWSILERSKGVRQQVSGGRNSTLEYQHGMHESSWLLNRGSTRRPVTKHCRLPSGMQGCSPKKEVCGCQKMWLDARLSQDNKRT